MMPEQFTSLCKPSVSFVRTNHKETNEFTTYLVNYCKETKTEIRIFAMPTGWVRWEWDIKPSNSVSWTYLEMLEIVVLIQAIQDFVTRIELKFFS